MPATDRPPPEGHRQIRFQRPAGATQILLVRHGESAALVEGTSLPERDGQGDPDLHPEGRQQAERIGERLAHDDIAAIYVSTLRRTAQTAAPLARRLGLEPTVEADLREVHLGEWEGGAFRRHAIEGHPIVAQIFEEQRWDVIPGAEDADEFASRLARAIGRIAAAHPDQCVAAFSHGAAIGQILATASGSAPFAFTGADNGSISEIVVQGERWTVRRYNDTAHLTADVEPPA
jgi:2,3-bisphosphoglycerate-dependent phosphoglycerate mutase